MPLKALCDFPTGKDGSTQCLSDAPISCLVTDEETGRTYKSLLCKVHGQQLINSGEPVSLPKAQTPTITQLPRVEPRKKQEQLITDPLVMKECRRWLESQGDLKENSRGRISQSLQSKYVAAGSPIEVSDGSWKVPA